MCVPRPARRACMTALPRPDEPANTRMPPARHECSLTARLRLLSQEPRSPSFVATPVTSGSIRSFVACEARIASANVWCQFSALRNAGA